MTATLYEYNVMPGKAWYGAERGKYLETDHDRFHDAARRAREMWQSGVRDIIINVYDLIKQELATFHYIVDDTTGKLIKK
jgi:hypothetical protein